jgi:hypothetical protein
MQCLALAAYMQGLAESELEDGGQSPFGKRVITLGEKFTAKLPPERFVEAGHADEAAIQKLFAVMLRDVSPIGNLMNVLSACEALP